MKHGTNTRGMERSGTVQGPKVTAFGKAAETGSQSSERGSWWATPDAQQDRAKFYELVDTYAPDMKPAMLPLKTGEGMS
jgi:cysteine sulfinate desulfinase/cysteine desulfurase-like protein